MSEMFDFFYEKPALVRYPWMETKKFVLVTPDTLPQCIDACINGKKGRFSLDLEGTGLDIRVSNGCTRDKIVGVCLSPDGETGYYIPLRHGKDGVSDPNNIPYMVFDTEFRRLMAAVDAGQVVAVFHNAKFDQQLLEYNGYGPYGDWSIPKNWEDTMILAYLRHSRARRKSLKILAGAPAEDPTPEQISQTGGRGLGMKMFELSDLFPKPEKGQAKPDYNFSVLDPTNEDVLIYGCSDAICTWLLADLLIEEVLNPKDHIYNQKVIYTIEKLCSVSIRWMEQNGLHTDPDKVMELIRLGQQEWFDAVMDVYQAASDILGRDVMPGYYKVLLHGSPEDGSGKFVNDNPEWLLNQQIKEAKNREKLYYPNPVMRVESKGKVWPSIYDVNAPQQLGQMFEEMNVPGLKHTEKSGQVMTSKAELERVIEEAADRFPFMGFIRRFRETNKALVSYLYPMLEDVDPIDKSMRIVFNGLKTDTGRFSTPTKEGGMDDKIKPEVPGFPNVNFQAMPATYDPKRPACMTRLRECIVAPKGYFIVAIDYSGEELRLVTNLSGEPLWLAEFFHCSSCNRKFDQGEPGVTPPPPPARCPNCGSDKIGDLHTLTALSIYGEDAANLPNWKALRGYAKSTNFALCYGGGGNAVVRACAVDKNEGWRIKSKFDSTYLGLQKWWEGQHRFAKKHSFVLTAFGRIYPVPDIQSSDGFFRSKAERNAVNGPIQGSGADIIKIAMALVYKECKKRGWLDLVRMIATVHDELVFEMHESVIEEALQVLTPIMTSNPLIAGKKWAVPLTTDCEIGKNWAVSWDLNAMRYREVRYEGDKKIKPPSKPSRDNFKGDEAAYQEALKDFPNKVAAWEAMPYSWPESLRKHFKNLGVDPESMSESPTKPSNGPISTPPVPEVGLATSSPSQAPVEAQTPKTPLEANAPKPMAKGDIFDFKLNCQLTPKACMALAEVIQRCQFGGTKKLRLLLPSGEVLEGWADQDYFVVPDQFYWMAVERKL